MTQKDQRDILGIDVAWLDWSQALERIEAALDSDQHTVFAFLNAHNANLAVRNASFRQALSRCVVLPDGLGMDIAARALYGEPFPANLNGTDFVPALLTHVSRPLDVAMVGARPEVLEQAQRRFAAHAPWHRFIPVSDGYVERQRTQAVLDRLAEIRPDLLLVAMGSPRQELWVDEHIRREHAKLVFTVGALFDFVSQSKPRAPRLLRLMRCEWIYRLCLEPRRLWRRYLLGNPLFLFRLFRYKVFGGKRSGKLPE